MNHNTRRALTSALAIAPAIILAPLAAHAQLGNTPFEKTLETAKGILNFALGVAVPVATLIFFWGVIQFMRAASSGDSKASDKAKSTMIYGGLGLFAMAGIWTIISYVTSSVGVTGGDVNVATPPTINIPVAK